MASALQWRQTWNGTVLSWAESWGEGGGAFSVVASSTLEFAGKPSIAGDFSIVASASFDSVNSTFNSASINIPGSGSVLWEGTEKAQPRAVTFAGTATATFVSNVGSAFLLRDDSASMNPEAAAIHNVALISVASALPIFAGSDAQDFKAFSIAATSALGFDAAPVHLGEFAAAGSLSATFTTIQFQAGELLVNAAAAATPWTSIGIHQRALLFSQAGSLGWGAYSRAEGRVSIASTGFVEFGQSAGAVGSAALPVTSASALSFTGTSQAFSAVGINAHLSGEFGQPGGGVEFGALILTQQLTLDFAAESVGASGFDIAARSTLDFHSDNFVEVDDDLKADADPRAIWQAAAQQEAWERDCKRLGKIARTDEDDLLILAAALSQAVSQARYGVRHA